MIPEEGASTENPNAVKKLVFCSGKVYYDLKKARNEKNLDKDIAIARVEQVLLRFFCCKGYLEQIFEILKLYLTDSTAVLGLFLMFCFASVRKFL